MRSCKCTAQLCKLRCRHTRDRTVPEDADTRARRRATRAQHGHACKARGAPPMSVQRAPHAGDRPHSAAAAPRGGEGGRGRPAGRRRPHGRARPARRREERGPAGQGFPPVSVSPAAAALATMRQVGLPSRSDMARGAAGPGGGGGRLLMRPRMRSAGEQGTRAPPAAVRRSAGLRLRGSAAGSSSGGGGPVVRGP